MRNAFAGMTAAVLLAIGPGSLARAQEAEPGEAEGAGFRLAVGIDYRSVDEYFYFYPSSYAETSGSAFGAAAEGAWLVGLGRLDVGVGGSIALGTGSADFTTPGPFTSNESIFVAHVEAFGEGGVRLTPSLSILGRLGLGYTAVLHDSADEGFTNLLLALGAHFALTPRVGVAAFYQFQLAGLGGTTDAGVTGAEPSLENHDNSAVQVRLTYRL